MDKITYLAELAEGLARWVPERERQDILRYYAEYFDEAGPGREAEVVAELGDPWALSCRLAVEGGYVTQEAANSWMPPQKRKVWPWALAGTLAAVVFIGVSVAFLAAQIGRFVGRGVADAVSVDVVEEWVDYGITAVEDDPSVIFFEDVGMNGGFWSVEDGTLDAFYAIDTEIRQGDIVVTAGQDYTLSIQCSGDLDGCGLSWETKGDTLIIKDSAPRGSSAEADGLKGLDVIITVPDGSILTTLTTKTDLGSIFLSDLRVEGKITAKTSVGSVDCYEVQALEKIDLKSNLGNITLYMETVHSGMEIDLETNGGNVEANLGCKEIDCEYELETSLGKVTVNGRDCGAEAASKGNRLLKLEAESSLGMVDVYFYEG